MSFILDALKKSEQERPRKGVPDLHTRHEIPAAAPKRRPLWPGVLALALLLNAILLLWWLRPWDRPQGAPVPAPPAAAPSVRVEAAPPPETYPPSAPVEKARAAVPPPAGRKSDPPAAEEPSVRPAAAVALQRDMGEKGAPDPPPPAGREEIPEMQGLPADVRRAIPPFDISLHFYTEAPASRMVRINGRNLREGDDVAEGLAVEKITASGVVLNWKGTRFRTGNY